MKHKAGTFANYVHQPIKIRLVRAVLTLLLLAQLGSRASAAGSGDPLEHWWQRWPHPDSAPLNDVIFANGAFFAIGDGGQLMRSADGETWAQSSIGLSKDLVAVIDAGNQFIVLGNEHNHVGLATIFSSSDGVSWNQSPVPSTILRAIAYGNGTFVAVGIRGSETSTDGKNWITTPTSRVSWNDIAYANGTFVAVGTTNTGTGFLGIVSSSVDGIH